MGWIYVAPSVLVLGAFGLLPMGYALLLSLQTDGGNWTGMAHYSAALKNDAFWQSVRVTLYYGVGTVPFTIALSLIAALALFRLRRFAAILRTAFFMPYITALVASALLWKALFRPRGGAINGLFERVGLPPQDWLIEPDGVLHILTGGAVSPEVGPSLALVSVILFEIWRSMGFTIVLLLAGLAAVPRELEDSARIDGASGARVFWHVTLPLISPTLFFLAIIGVIQALQAFSSLYAMTGDGRGPLDTTQTVTVYIFTNFYEFGRMEYGSAVAVLLALGVVAMTALQYWVLRPAVYYE